LTLLLNSPPNPQPDILLSDPLFKSLCGPSLALSPSILSAPVKILCGALPLPLRSLGSTRTRVLLPEKMDQANSPPVGKGRPFLMQHQTSSPYPAHNSSTSGSPNLRVGSTACPSPRHNEAFAAITMTLAPHGLPVVQLAVSSTLSSLSLFRLWSLTG
jgi:hypothetical protein